MPKSEFLDIFERLELLENTFLTQIGFFFPRGSKGTHLSPTQVSCSISVITSAISNFSRCGGGPKGKYIKREEKCSLGGKKKGTWESNTLNPPRPSLTSMSSRSSFFRRRMLDSSSLSSRERSSGTGRKDEAQAGAVEVGNARVQPGRQSVSHRVGLPVPLPKSTPPIVSRKDL